MPRAQMANGTWTAVNATVMTVNANVARVFIFIATTELVYTINVTKIDITIEAKTARVTLHRPRRLGIS